MTDLDGARFAEFYHQVWDTDAFDWQVRLASQVIADGRWPAVIDLPTGAGKTSAIDIALYALAARPSHFPRRVLFVIDRRIVVDQTTRRAEQLAVRLANASTGVVAEVRSRLEGLSSAGTPFVVDRLRGGRPIGAEWAKSPDQPAIVVSTVDQVGSRLFFRGYGVSPRMWPVHAGLVGNDCLILLDEVHLSRPFAETLLAIEGRAGRTVAGLPRRWQVVQMSATPIDVAAAPFRLEVDRDLADPDSELTVRMRARKEARLVVVPDQRKPVDEVLAREAGALVDDVLDGAGVVGFIVNRVASARRVAAELAQQGRNVLLLTGRMRPLDRDRVVAEVEAATNPERSDEAGGTTIVVTTQCIEVGADISFDAMVTEVAPVSSLRQRFGRLDRRGRLARAGRPAHVSIVGVGSELRADRPDPIYADAMRATWDALIARFGDEPFDVGPMTTAFEGFPGDAEVIATHAPVILPAHLDALVQTDPAPSAGPVVADFLHGVVDSDPDVSIVWRGDLDPANIGAARTALAALPPMAMEAMAVPLVAARRWLAERQPSAVSDVDSTAVADEEDVKARGRQAVHWRGRDDVEAISPANIAPGDVLVVPARYGGISAGTWDPTNDELVVDVGDLASVTDGSAVVRITVAELGTDAGDDEAGAVDDQARTWIAENATTNGAAAMLYAVGWVSLRTVSYRLADDSSAVAVMPRRLQRPAAFMDGSDEANSFTGVREPVSLAAHLAGVGAKAREFAERCGLGDAWADDMDLAGRLHDLGKADPRFQVKLHGSEVLAAISPEPIAKSGRSPALATWAGHGYPLGMRHEFMSVELICSHPSVVAAAHDEDLVLHLVASHHGRARPWPAFVEDPAPIDVTIDHGGVTLAGRSDLPSDAVGVASAERFWRLVGRYGWHGLAWLEAIFRLADHRCSEEEARV